MRRKVLIIGLVFFGLVLSGRDPLSCFAGESCPRDAKDPSAKESSKNSPADVQSKAAEKFFWGNRLSIFEIIQMKERGMSDEAIISALKASGASYGLSSEAIRYLKEKGISDRVIIYMLSSRPIF